MTKHTDDNDTPDISGIFNIDENEIPDKIIKKVSGDTNKKITPILTSSEARKSLPKEDRNALKKDDRRRKREKQSKTVKKNVLIILVIAVAVVIVLLSSGNRIKNADIPKVELTTPEITTLSEYYTTEKAVVIDTEQGKTVLFFDNEYSVHNIKSGQTAVVTTLEGTKVECIIKKIAANEPDDSVVQNYYGSLVGGTPSTLVYTVYAVSEDKTAFTQDDNKIKSVTITTLTSENTLVLPKEAVEVHPDESGSLFRNTYCVWVYSKKTSEITSLTVTTGIITDNSVEITSALSPDAQVVLRASCDFSELKDGMKVKVK